MMSLASSRHADLRETAEYAYRTLCAEPWLSHAEFLDYCSAGLVLPSGYVRWTNRILTAAYDEARDRLVAAICGRQYEAWDDEQDTRRPHTVQEAADILGVSTDTVETLARREILRYGPEDPPNTYSGIRYAAGDVNALARIMRRASGESDEIAPSAP